MGEVSTTTDTGHFHPNLAPCRRCDKPVRIAIEKDIEFYICPGDPPSPNGKKLLIVCDNCFLSEWVDSGIYRDIQ